MRKFLNSFCYMKNGFSLMEMMIVLLVVAIIAAATAPMIAKKSARSGGSGGAISHLGMGENIGNNGNGAFVLGGIANHNSKLFIERGTHRRHIGFGNGGNNPVGILNITDEHGIALGSTDNAPGQNGVEIGSGSNASGQDSIAIGTGATASGTNSVAIGNGANPAAAINDTATQAFLPANLANADKIVHISTGSTGPNDKGIIILGGPNDDVVIPGHLATTMNLGGPGTNTVIEGNLIVKGIFATENQICYFDTEDGRYLTARKSHGNDYIVRDAISDNYTHNGRTIDFSPVRKDLTKVNMERDHGGWSDRRLKNVGKSFTGGLEELRKIEVYNFTFKKDKEKTPQVGVMAQDLQKVFPNAVWEGSDKYLRIRWDEMFYAVINAVKELDSKVTSAFLKIKSNSDKIAELQETIDVQKQEITELKAQNKAFEKRLARLEKKAEKKAKKEE